MEIPRKVPTVVIGAGQAGLVMSYHLRQAGREHIVLDRRETLGGGWQDRWDAFQLVTPNWVTSFPGNPYNGQDPDGFMTRDEVVHRVAAYAQAIDAPVRLGVAVSRLVQDPDGGFRLETSAGPISADAVVIAVGSYHIPRVPPLAAALPPWVAQVHSHDYRRESLLPLGGVLVVGSGQSGVQLAEELRDAGRLVYLSVGSAGRVPRRYRGSDFFCWMSDVATKGPALGMGLPTVEMLANPRLRFTANPHVSGHGGGHETNLRQLAQDGITLVGHLASVDGPRIRFAPDLIENLDHADAVFAERFQSLFDRYITLAEIDAPPDDRQPVVFDPPLIDELDLKAADIGTVLWTTGYRPDFSWIDLPILDDMGLPKQHRGVSDVPGLYFVGLLWQHTQASGTLLGPTLDAHYLLEAMGLPGPG